MGFFGGGGGGGGGPYEVITSSQTLSQQKSYMVDTSSSAYSVTLPASPANGDYVEIFDRANTFGTNNLTIARNGNNIESLAEDLIGNVSGAAFRLAYADSTTGWQIIPFYGFAGPNFVGASTSTAGTAGVVPSPAAGKNTRALFSDASFGEVPLMPQYKNTDSGQYIINFGYGLGSSSGASTATIKVRRFTLMYVPADGNIDMLSYRTASGWAGSSTNCHVALWEVAQDGSPSSYIIGGIGASGSAQNTDINISISSTAVKRGFYWMSLTPEATMTLGVLRVDSSSNGYLFIGTSVLSNTFNTFGYTATTYDQTTHETMTILASQPFRLGFQYV